MTPAPVRSSRDRLLGTNRCRFLALERHECHPRNRLLDRRSTLALAFRATWWEYPSPRFLRLHRGRKAGAVAARTRPLLDGLFWPVRFVGAHRFPRLILLVIFEYLGVRVYDFSVLGRRNVRQVRPNRSVIRKFSADILPSRAGN